MCRRVGAGLSRLMLIAQARKAAMGIPVLVTYRIFGWPSGAELKYRRYSRRSNWQGARAGKWETRRKGRVDRAFTYELRHLVLTTVLTVVTGS